MKSNKLDNIKDLIMLTTNEDIKNENFELDENYMFALTKDNSEKALKCIKNSNRYKVSSYCVYYKELGKSLYKYTLEEWKKIIWNIARSNSTRTSNENIEVLAKHIFDKRDEFLKRLKNGDVKLVDEMTAIKGYTRREKSLASKVCNYLCELEFEKSNFAVNDNVVRKILPYYLNYYGVSGDKKELSKCTYCEIISLIDGIIAKLPEKMTYSEIDRIIWYCYKNDPIRSEIAVALA